MVFVYGPKGAAFCDCPERDTPPRDELADLRDEVESLRRALHAEQACAVAANASFDAAAEELAEYKRAIDSVAHERDRLRSALDAARAETERLRAALAGLVAACGGKQPTHTSHPCALCEALAIARAALDGRGGAE
jgi:septal ring factor EnvC (AmiA/AmiB activator)